MPALEAIANGTAAQGGTGYLKSASTVYATALAGGGTTTLVGASTTSRVGQQLNGATYEIYQAFLSFDTSSIPSNAVIDDVRVFFTNASDQSQKDFILQLFAYDFGATLGTGNFQAGASPTPGVLCGTIDTSAGLATPEFALIFPNAQNAIVKGGTTRFVIVSSLQGTQPGAGGLTEYDDFDDGSHATSAFRPRLRVSWHTDVKLIAPEGAAGLTKVTIANQAYPESGSCTIGDFTPYAFPLTGTPSAASSSFAADQSNPLSNFRVHQALIAFDTSVIPDDAVIDFARLRIQNAGSFLATGSDPTSTNVYAHDYRATNITTLASIDYVKQPVGSIPDPLVASFDNASAIATPYPQAWWSTAAFPAAINRQGKTRLVMVVSTLGVQPSGAEGNQSFSGPAGLNYLDVWYHMPDEGGGASSRKKGRRSAGVTMKTGKFRRTAGRSKGFPT